MPSVRQASELGHGGLSSEAAKSGSAIRSAASAQRSLVRTSTRQERDPATSHLCLAGADDRPQSADPRSVARVLPRRRFPGRRPSPRRVTARCLGPRPSSAQNAYKSYSNLSNRRSRNPLIASLPACPPHQHRWRRRCICGQESVEFVAHNSVLTLSANSPGTDTRPHQQDSLI